MAAACPAIGFADINDWLETFAHFWEPKLDALATEIARGKKKRNPKR